MIKGTGIDIVEINRIKKIYQNYKDSFAKRILCQKELEELSRASYKERYLAKKFAAKEAVVKALGTGFSQGINPRMICVDHDEHGKPLVILSNNAKEMSEAMGVDNIWLSISDEKSHAIAFVVLEKTSRPG